MFEDTLGLTGRKESILVNARRNNRRRSYFSAKTTASMPTRQPSTSVILYTRQGCHLCDEAASVLARHDLAFEPIDVDQDPALRERYNECVPVVVIDGKERFRGRVDELLLRRLLANRAS
jgi:glutaredoxin